MDRIEKLKSLFLIQKSYIDFFFDHISIEDAHTILDLLLNCSGTIFITGVGKSGIVANKLATTLVSIGTKASYLNPLDALHGDLGIVSKEDIVIFLTKSGNTKELVSLIPPIKKRGATIMSWISSRNSKLESLSDFTIYLPVLKELCPFDLAPTTSPAIQMIFGDILITSIMQQKHFTLDQYALNHPAGAIGKKASFLVEDLMLKGDTIPTCFEEQLLKEVIVELTNKRCGCVLIFNREKQLKGIFTDGDLRRSLQKFSDKAFHMSMEQLMTRSFLFTHKKALAIEAMHTMQQDGQRRVMALPVVENNQVEGLICMHDIIAAGLK